MRPVTAGAEAGARQGSEGVPRGGGGMGRAGARAGFRRAGTGVPVSILVVISRRGGRLSRTWTSLQREGLQGQMQRQRRPDEDDRAGQHAQKDQRDENCVLAVEKRELVDGGAWSIAAFGHPASRVRLAGAERECAY